MFTKWIATFGALVTLGAATPSLAHHECDEEMEYDAPAQSVYVPPAPVYVPPAPVYVPPAPVRDFAYQRWLWRQRMARERFAHMRFRRMHFYRYGW